MEDVLSRVGVDTEEQREKLGRTKTTTKRRPVF